MLEKTQKYDEILVSLDSAVTGAGSAVPASVRSHISNKLVAAIGGAAAAQHMEKIDHDVFALPKTVLTNLAGLAAGPGGTSISTSASSSSGENTFLSALCENDKIPLPQHLWEIVLKRRTVDPLRSGEFVLFSQLPRAESEELDSVGNSSALFEEVARRVVEYATPVTPSTELADAFFDMDISLRFVQQNGQKIDKKDSMSANWLRDTFLKGQRAQCALEENLYEERVQYWERRPEKFYDYVHTFFENYRGNFCGDTYFRPDTLQEVALSHRGDATAVVRDVGTFRNDVTYTYTDKITGLRHVPVHVYFKVNMADPQMRRRQAEKIQDILENERQRRPDMWGVKDVDSFFYADFMREAERDTDLGPALDRFLLIGFITVAVVLFVVQLHLPAIGYGTISSIITSIIAVPVIGMTICELLGLMEVCGFSLNFSTATGILLAVGLQLLFVLPLITAGTFTSSTPQTKEVCDERPSKTLSQTSLAALRIQKPTLAVLSLLLVGSPLSMALTSTLLRPMHVLLLFSHIFAIWNVFLFLPPLIGLIEMPITGRGLFFSSANKSGTSKVVPGGSTNENTNNLALSGATGVLPT
ncbi:unnamed protein product [Amoebophrya sp. A25]|nr:unnamed protein product [Amoebophrya sp. A25]|eukprot:GSA25T00007203001.1